MDDEKVQFCSLFWADFWTKKTRKNKEKNRKKMGMKRRRKREIVDMKEEKVMKLRKGVFQVNIENDEQRQYKRCL